jgi:hypothetical protein
MDEGSPSGVVSGTDNDFRDGFDDPTLVDVGRAWRALDALFILRLSLAILRAKSPDLDDLGIDGMSGRDLLL